MKRIFLLTILSFSIIFTLSSQISIKDVSGNAIEGTEQIGTAETPYNFLISNNGTSDIEIIMVAVKLSIPEGVKMMQICGNGNCMAFTSSFDKEEIIGSQTLSIPAGTTSDIKEDFHVEYDNNGVTKEASVAVKFYEKGNESNSANVDVIYFKGSNSIGVNNLKSISLYPNPAKDFIYLSYDNLKHGQLIIRNIVGKEVKKININSGDAGKKVSVSDLQEGVYLYSVTENGKTVVTRKLIINR